MPDISYNIKIPVKAYVAKVYQNSITKDARMLLHAMMERKFYHYRKNVDVTTYDHELQVALTEDEFYRYGSSIAPANVIGFNNFLEAQVKRIFENALLSNIVRSEREKKNFLKSEMILATRDSLNLTEEEFSFDAIKKHLDRYCLRNKIEYKSRIKFGEVVPYKVQRSATEIETAVSIPHFLETTQIKRRTFFHTYRKQLSTFRSGNELLILTESIPEPWRCLFVGESIKPALYNVV